VNDKRSDEGTKVAFEPPRLVAIELAADEVLANACKLDVQTSALDSQPCSVTSCGYRGS
jgi:hypothetical protein